MDVHNSLLFSVINIILIDIILGGDNAVVIAMACRKLPSRSRNKAILMGTILAVLLRIVLTAIMLSLLQIPYLLFIGGCFLVLIAYKLIADKDDDPNIKAGTSFFSAVRTIVFADLVMGLDNILGIAGAANGNLLLVVLGLCVSVPIIIWGSKLILVAMDHVPGLIYLGSAVLAYTASGMIAGEPKFHVFFADHLQYKSIITALIIVGVLFGGWIKNHGESSRVI
jgi:YjbE family integral membrane protein